MDLDSIPVMFIKQSNSRMDDKSFGFVQTMGMVKDILARTIYPSSEKPHTRHTASVRGPSFIMFTHFTPRIKLNIF